jgi:thioredoxin-like negative regulator of GroEL
VFIENQGPCHPENAPAREPVFLFSERKEIMAKPTDLTSETLQAWIDACPVAVLDCWAPWCRPCLSLEPEFEKVATELEGQACFGRLNCDEHPEAASVLGVRGLPTLIIFVGGLVVGFHAVAGYSARRLRALIEPYLTR